MAAEWEAGLEGVRGWLRIEEARLLHELAARQHPSGACVEIGAYQGRSAIAIASALPDGHRLLSVDTFAGSPEHQPGERYFDPATLTEAGAVDTLAAFLHNTGRAGLAARVEPWRMTSAEAAARWAGRVALSVAARAGGRATGLVSARLAAGTRPVVAASARRSRAPVRGRLWGMLDPGLSLSFLFSVNEVWPDGRRKARAS
jgi:hypothetical protein